MQKESLSKQIDSFINRTTPAKLPFLRKVFKAYTQALLTEEAFDQFQALESLTSFFLDDKSISPNNLFFNSFSPSVQYYLEEPYLSILSYSMQHKDLDLCTIIANELFDGAFEVMYGDSYDAGLTLFYTDGSRIYPYIQDKPYTDSDIFAVSEQASSRLISLLFYSDVRPDYIPEGFTLFDHLTSFSSFNSKQLKNARFLTLVLPARLSCMVVPTYSMYYAIKNNAPYSVGVHYISGPLQNTAGGYLTLRNKTIRALQNVYTKAKSSAGYLTNFTVTNEDRTFCYLFRINSYENDVQIEFLSNQKGLSGHIFTPVASVKDGDVQLLPSAQSMYFKIYIEYPSFTISEIQDMPTYLPDIAVNGFYSQESLDTNSQDLIYVGSIDSGILQYSLSQSSISSTPTNLTEGSWKVYIDNSFSVTEPKVFALSQDNRGLYLYDYEASEFKPIIIRHPLDSSKALELTFGNFQEPSFIDGVYYFPCAALVNQTLHNLCIYKEDAASYLTTESLQQGTFTKLTEGIVNSFYLYVAGSVPNPIQYPTLDYDSTSDISQFVNYPAEYPRGLVYLNGSSFVHVSGPDEATTEYLNSSFWDTPVYNPAYTTMVSRSLSGKGICFTKQGYIWQKTNIYDGHYSQPIYVESFSRYYVFSLDPANPGVYTSTSGEVWEPINSNLTGVTHPLTGIPVYSISYSIISDSVLLSIQDKILESEDGFNFKVIYSGSKQAKIFSINNLDFFYDRNDSITLFRGSSGELVTPANADSLATADWDNLYFYFSTDTYYLTSSTDSQIKSFQVG